MNVALSRLEFPDIQPARTGGIQIVATTHSPVVLQWLSEEALDRAIVFGRVPDREGTLMRRLGELPHFSDVVKRKGIDELAIHRDAIPTPWQSIRAERDPKERFAHPFLAERAPRFSAGAGRAWAMRSLGPKWKGVLEVCPELESLKQELRGWLSRRR